MNTEFLPNKKHMLQCLKLAKIAGDLGEVPVGALIELNGEVIAFSHNLKESLLDPTAHAEVLAIKQASEKLGTWRLSGANIYISLEPCPMCMGAIINSRIDRVIFAAHEQRSGCLGGLVDFTKMNFTHTPLVYRGFMEEESLELMKSFFAKLR